MSANFILVEIDSQLVAGCVLEKARADGRQDETRASCFSGQEIVISEARKRNGGGGLVCNAIVGRNLGTARAVCPTIVLATSSAPVFV